MQTTRPTNLRFCKGLKRLIVDMHCLLVGYGNIRAMVVVDTRQRHAYTGMRHEMSIVPTSYLGARNVEARGCSDHVSPEPHTYRDARQNLNEVIVVETSEHKNSRNAIVDSCSIFFGYHRTLNIVHSSQSCCSPFFD